ncbi:MAG: hypothetical protein DMD28_00805 [Gemmatimonadetes bacterium]|nr:MAG: hypothetical protein DMD28_00805 [Gemmatimonadota bacterium]
MRLEPHARPRRPVRQAALRPRVCGGAQVIDDKALELGRLLGQSEEYRALVRATDRMKEDAECQKLLAEVERVAQQIDRAAQAGQEPNKEQVEQYDRALETAQANAVYQQVVAAQANFEKLMARMNARIYEGIKKGAASPIITLT